MSLILAKSSTGAPGLIQKSETILPTQTTVVDTASSTVTWQVTIVRADPEKQQAYHVIATKDGIGDANHTIYGTVGDPIDHSINVDTSNNELRMSVTNNELQSITVTSLAIKTR